MVLEYSQFFDYLTFSLFTYFEITSGLQYKDAKNILPIFENLAAESEILHPDHQTMNIASEIYGDLRKRGLLIPVMDIFIAATAIQYDLLLITNNTKDFERIKGVCIQDWSKA
ncbi:MAG: PIN domain-containing protein [Limnothrix sp.]